MSKLLSNPRLLTILSIFFLIQLSGRPCLADPSLEVTWKIDLDKKCINLTATNKGNQVLKLSPKVVIYRRLDNELPTTKDFPFLPDSVIHPFVEIVFSPKASDNYANSPEGYNPPVITLSPGDTRLITYPFGRSSFLNEDPKVLENIEFATCGLVLNDKVINSVKLTPLSGTLPAVPWYISPGADPLFDATTLVKLKTLRVSVRWENGTDVESALNDLGGKIKQVDPSHSGIHVVLSDGAQVIMMQTPDPRGPILQRKVALILDNAPLIDVFGYLCEQTGLTIQVGKNLVTLRKHR
jgi:hypothetical protein